MSRLKGGADGLEVAELFEASSAAGICLEGDEAWLKCVLSGGSWNGGVSGRGVLVLEVPKTRRKKPCLLFVESTDGWCLIMVGDDALIVRLWESRVPTDCLREEGPVAGPSRALAKTISDPVRAATLPRLLICGLKFSSVEGPSEPRWKIVGRPDEKYPLFHSADRSMGGEVLLKTWYSAGTGRARSRMDEEGGAGPVRDLRLSCFSVRGFSAEAADVDEARVPSLDSKLLLLLLLFFLPCFELAGREVVAERAGSLVSISGFRGPGRSLLEDARGEACRERIGVVRTL